MIKTNLDKLRAMNADDAAKFLTNNFNTVTDNLPVVENQYKNWLMRAV